MTTLSILTTRALAVLALTTLTSLARASCETPKRTVLGSDMGDEVADGTTPAPAPFEVFVDEIDPDTEAYEVTVFPLAL